MRVAPGARFPEERTCRFLVASAMAHPDRSTGSDEALSRVTLLLAPGPDGIQVGPALTIHGWKGARAPRATLLSYHFPMA